MYSYVIIDLETTGLDTKSDRVISIAAKVFQRQSDQQQQQQQHCHFFINPYMPNNAYIINKIDDELLSTCLGFEQTIKLFWEWIRNNCTEERIVFIGHNIDYFDETMLLAEFSRTRSFSLIPSEKQFFKIDTMKIFKYVFPVTSKNLPYGLPLINYAPESYKQVDVYSFLFNKLPREQHDALGDVNALGEILNLEVFKNLIFMATPEFSRIQYSSPRSSS